MDEATWSSSIDPQAMLVFLSGKVSDRKLRLFACAVCRRIWHLFPDEVGRGAVEVAECFADGLATEEELADALTAAESAFSNSGGAAFAAWGAAANGTNFAVAGGAGYAAKEAAQAAAGLPHLPTDSSPWEWTRPDDFAAKEGALRAERAHQASLLRDTCNPFRPVTVAPACRTPDVLRLAEAAYAERSLPLGHLDNARLNVLADALEDAGAAGALLEHLRAPGAHVRGCVALDAILGRS
jgi:hypothetical protein